MRVGPCCERFGVANAYCEGTLGPAPDPLLNIWLTGLFQHFKKVLPAVLEASPYLASRYTDPSYGTEKISSLNFSAMNWFRSDASGKVMDPYAILPEVQESQWAATLRDIEVLYDEERVAHGGAAMTAWAYMQFAEMSDTERDALCGMLKQYCELDTLAMVMILEFILNEV